MSDLKLILWYTLGVTLFLGGFAVLSEASQNHNVHVDCLRLSEGTGLPVKVTGPLLGRKCFVFVDGRWVPASQWRADANF